MGIRGLDKFLGDQEIKVVELSIGSTLLVDGISWFFWLIHSRIEFHNGFGGLYSLFDSLIREQICELSLNLQLVFFFDAGQSRLKNALRMERNMKIADKWAQFEYICMNKMKIDESVKLPLPELYIHQLQVTLMEMNIGVVYCVEETHMEMAIMCNRMRMSGNSCFCYGNDR
jgi:hypothetical protein